MFGLFEKDEYMEWKEYKQKINMIDTFLWSQKIRQRNVQNMVV